MGCMMDIGNLKRYDHVADGNLDKGHWLIGIYAIAFRRCLKMLPAAISGIISIREIDGIYAIDRSLCVFRCMFFVRNFVR